MKSCNYLLHSGKFVTHSALEEFIHHIMIIETRVQIDESNGLHNWLLEQHLNSPCLIYQANQGTKHEYLLLISIFIKNERE